MSIWPGKSGMDSYIKKALKRDLTDTEVVKHLKERGDGYMRESEMFVHPDSKTLSAFLGKHLLKAAELIEKAICNDTSSRCLQCNDPFAAKTARAKFCSGKCRTAYNRKKNES
jgi:hypothetical protein